MMAEDARVKGEETRKVESGEWGGRVAMKVAEDIQLLPACRVAEVVALNGFAFDMRRWSLLQFVRVLHFSPRSQMGPCAGCLDRTFRESRWQGGTTDPW